MHFQYIYFNLSYHQHLNKCWSHFHLKNINLKLRNKLSLDKTYKKRKLWGEKKKKKHTNFFSKYSLICYSLFHSYHFGSCTIILPRLWTNTTLNPRGAFQSKLCWCLSSNSNTMATSFLRHSHPGLWGYSDLQLFFLSAVSLNPFSPQPKPWVCQFFRNVFQVLFWFPINSHPLPYVKFLPTCQCLQNLFPWLLWSITKPT